MGPPLLPSFSLTIPTDLALRTISQGTVYNFDDLTPQDVIVALTSLGTYRDLDFNNLVLASQGIAGTPAIGLNLNSPPNTVAYTLRTEVVNGVPGVKIPGNGMGAKYFILKSLNFGCTTATVQSTAKVPVACRVEATCSRNGSMVGAASETFIPFADGTSLAPNLKTFNLPVSIGDTDSVVFDVKVADLPQALKAVTGVALDDFNLIIYD